VRISKYAVKCLGCGTELTVYPRHIQHKEPIPCPECGRRNSADEYDLTEQIEAERRKLERMMSRNPIGDVDVKR